MIKWEGLKVGCEEECGHHYLPTYYYIPTNIDIVRCTVSVATIVVVSAGVDI